MTTVKLNKIRTGGAIINMPSREEQSMIKGGDGGYIQ
jgi:hypothetical protein